MCAGNIEVWLQRLVDGMQGTMKAIVKRAYRNVQEMGFAEFVFSHPAQVALLGIQFQWTADMQARPTRSHTSTRGLIIGFWASCYVYSGDQRSMHPHGARWERGKCTSVVRALCNHPLYHSRGVTHLIERKSFQVL